MYVKWNIEVQSCNNCCSGKEMSITYCECVCVCECVCECVCVCVSGVCVCVCSLIYPACNTYAPYFHLWTVGL